MRLAIYLVLRTDDWNSIVPLACLVASDFPLPRADGLLKRSIRHAHLPRRLLLRKKHAIYRERNRLRRRLIIADATDIAGMVFHSGSASSDVVFHDGSDHAAIGSRPVTCWGDFYERRAATGGSGESKAAGGRGADEVDRAWAASRTLPARREGQNRSRTSGGFGEAPRRGAV